MLRGIEAVELEILRCPVEVAVGQVDADGAARTTARSIDRRAARIAEEIQEARRPRAFTQPSPRQSMVEKQAGVEIIVEIHQKLKPPLFDRERSLSRISDRRG